MKKPVIKNCPCCGVELRVIGSPISTVEPICKDQLHSVTGSLITFILSWRCMVCGCEFTDQNMDAVL